MRAPREESCSFSFSAATVLIFRASLTGGKGQGQSVPCDPKEEDCRAAGHLWLTLLIWRDRQMFGARCWALEINQARSGTSTRGTWEACWGRGAPTSFLPPLQGRPWGRRAKAGASQGRWTSVAELVFPLGILPAPICTPGLLRGLFRRLTAVASL